MSNKYLEISENVREENVLQIQKIIQKFLKFRVSKIYSENIQKADLQNQDLNKSIKKSSFGWLNKSKSLDNQNANNPKLTSINH